MRCDSLTRRDGYPSSPYKPNVPPNDAEIANWFEKLGWAKRWDWCPPGGTPSFGAVGSGEAEIFLCLNGQGVCLSIWVDDVDESHEH